MVPFTGPGRAAIYGSGKRDLPSTGSAAAVCAAIVIDTKNTPFFGLALLSNENAYHRSSLPLPVSAL